MPITDTFAGKNAGSPANLFEQRVTDPIRNGHEALAQAGQNSTVTGGQQFEQRATSTDNTTH
jgi:hypothetical protein